MTFSAEARHPIRLVVRRTGLTAATIRAWERRYEAIEPQRTPTNRRLYSDADIERLRLLRQATLAGHSISAIASLSDDYLAELVDAEAIHAQRVPEGAAASGGRSDASAHVEICFTAVEELDGVRLEVALQKAALEMDAIRLMDSVLTPLVHRVGDLWRRGRLRISHEHLATAVVESFLQRLRRSSPVSGSDPVLLVTTVAGQTHELGSLMVSVAAAVAGWRVVYMGPNMPAGEIADAAARAGAHAVAVSLVHPEADPAVDDELTLLSKLLPSRVHLIVGGRATESYRRVLEEARAHRPGSLAGLRRELEALGAESRASSAVAD